MIKIIFSCVWLLFLPLAGQAAETVRVAGSTTVLPIVSEAAKQYRESHPRVRITVSGGGSGVGIASILQHSADLGMSSREPTPEEQARLDGQAELISVARDAVAVVVSKAVAVGGVKTLTLDQIAAIYRGEIANWKQVGGPDADILVIDKEPGRGTRHVFAKAVLGDERARAPGARLIAGSNNEEQAIVARSNSAIGMLSNAWLNDRVRSVAVIVDGEPIPPTAKNIRSGRYPISRDLFLLMPQDAPTEVADFVDFILSPPGQKIVSQVGYLPVR
ncbi:MAG: phosphate ABC transporter substrate-binding protein [Methylohalobius sp. ZOD2]